MVPVGIATTSYGKNINFTGRSQFDIEKRTETPFLLKLQTA